MTSPSVFPVATPAPTLTVDQNRRKQLRRELRARRRALSPVARKRAALALTRQLLKLPQVRRSRHIALYLPNDGEIDPRYFVTVARRLGKTCYLPLLHPVHPNRLWFFRFDADTVLFPNRFGIPEPPRDHRKRRAASALDLVLLPLVGFDAAGGRLGMGGGFYDRIFAFRLGHNRTSPALIGLAHECQRVDSLPTAPWDVPLDAVVSDQSVYAGSVSSMRCGDRERRDEEKGREKQSRFMGRYRLRHRRYRSALDQ